jgi:hypothetical protein
MDWKLKRLIDSIIGICEIRLDGRPRFIESYPDAVLPAVDRVVKHCRQRASEEPETHEIATQSSVGSAVIALMKVSFVYIAPQNSTTATSIFPYTT